MNSGVIRQLRDLLISEIGKSSNVFIVGHNSPDFDSIGSATGLYALARSLRKRVYIIVDDDDTIIEPGVKRIIEESKNKIFYIKKNDFLRMVNDKSLLIVTDVNKKDMIAVGDCLDKVGNTIVIDHHSVNANTIDTPYKYISEDVSSASEIVTRVLWSQHLKYSKEIANYLLAGINLDTHRFKQNTTSRTHDVAQKLIDKGAEIDYVNDFFLEEIESYCRINRLIVNGIFVEKYSDYLTPINVSFTINRNPNTFYLKEEYAKAADTMMEFREIDAAFALGYISKETIHISARGGRKVNVGKIMDLMSGGGNEQSAGTRIIGRNIVDVEDELMSIIPLGFENEDIITEDLPAVKRKQFKRF